MRIHPIKQLISVKPKVLRPQAIFSQIPTSKRDFLAYEKKNTSKFKSTELKKSPYASIRIRLQFVNFSQLDSVSDIILNDAGTIHAMYYRVT